MKRRTFLRNSLSVTALPLLLNGLPIKVLGKGSMLETALQNSTATDRVLVIIQLSGGNDGLNTVIPLDQYTNLSNARANIMIADNKVLALNDTAVTGLHPSMAGIQDLYNNKMSTIIQGVSYPDPNYSHFRATDIWLTGADSDTVLTTGWAGRFLDQEYPNFPTGYPNADSPDPLAIQVGSVVSTALQGPQVSMGMAITSSTDFYNLVNGTYDPAPNTPAGHELTFIRQTSTQTQQYTTVIKNAALAQQNLSTMYPAAGTNSLADQLKIVAQLIGGGLKTKIYMVGYSGFDTHNSQVDSSDTSTGQHADLLDELSVAVAAFEDDLHLMNKQDNVIGMTFSEFGRRIASNASLGTDHGSSEPVFLFGSQLKGGMLGHNPVIPATVTVNDNLDMQFDFRSIYASILKGWFCVSDTELASVMLDTYPILDLFKSDSSGIDEVANNDSLLPLCYPNPVHGSTTIRFQSLGGSLQITLYDSQGRQVETMLEGTYPAGQYQSTFDASKLAPGIYFYTLRQGNTQATQRMLVE